MLSVLLLKVLSAQQLVYMAVQIARGLQQLHRRRLLHRDVAARNCMYIALFVAFSTSSFVTVFELHRDDCCR